MKAILHLHFAASDWFNKHRNSYRISSSNQGSNMDQIGGKTMSSFSIHLKIALIWPK